MGVPPTLALAQVSTSFGAVGALRDVPRDLLAGRAHASGGETDAGKSGLVKPVAGVRRPDALLSGDSVVFNDPSDVQCAGDSVVFDDPSDVQCAGDSVVFDDPSDVQCAGNSVVFDDPSDVQCAGGAGEAPVPASAAHGCRTAPASGGTRWPPRAGRRWHPLRKPGASHRARRSGRPTPGGMRGAWRGVDRARCRPPRPMPIAGWCVCGVAFRHRSVAAPWGVRAWWVRSPCGRWCSSQGSPRRAVGLFGMTVQGCVGRREPYEEGRCARAAGLFCAEGEG